MKATAKAHRNVSIASMQNRQQKKPSADSAAPMRNWLRELHDAGKCQGHPTCIYCTDEKAKGRSYYEFWKLTDKNRFL